MGKQANQDSKLSLISFQIWPFFSGEKKPYKTQFLSYKKCNNLSSSKVMILIPAEVSLNLSLVFFFLHFQGLKILPMVESFPFLLKGGVCEPAVGPSEFAREALSSPSTV